MFCVRVGGMSICRCGVVPVQRGEKGGGTDSRSSETHYANYKQIQATARISPPPLHTHSHNLPPRATRCPLVPPSGEAIRGKCAWLLGSRLHRSGGRPSVGSSVLPRGGGHVHPIWPWRRYVCRASTAAYPPARLRACVSVRACIYLFVHASVCSCNCIYTHVRACVCLFVHASVCLHLNGCDILGCL